jgi:hypothetical protein
MAHFLVSDEKYRDALREFKPIMSAWRPGLRRGGIASHLFPGDAWPELGILVRPPA